MGAVTTPHQIPGYGDENHCGGADPSQVPPKDVRPRTSFLRVGWSISFDSSNEAVTAFWQGLDVARMLGGIAQRLAQAGDGGVQVVVEVDEDVVPPEPPVQFLAGDNFARVFEQRGKHLERLVAEVDPHAVFVELA
ncbi:MAG: hypothetical protein WCC59_13065 [Terriglobales bacterium]